MLTTVKCGATLGNSTLENAQLACPHCNASKGARDFPVTPPAGYRGSWPPQWWGR
jgi:filamentous hemagglutinin